MLAWGQASYQPVSWDALTSGQAKLGLVRLWGRYLPFADYQGLVRGVLTDGSYSLRVEGSVFDWRPTVGEYIEVWGRLERGQQSYVLHFYNGRELGQNRQPRPTPSLSAGVHLSLVLKVTLGGNLPHPFYQGVTEDGQVFTLPGYQGSAGVVCLQGTVQPLGKGWALADAKPCAP